MRPKIIALRQFYASRLGHRVKRRLRAHLMRAWPQHAGEAIVGIGYATPLLRVLGRADGKPGVVALMPASQAPSTGRCTATTAPCWPTRCARPSPATRCTAWSCCTPSNTSHAPTSC
ncbi:MAG: hypothetical protein WDN72_07335 [Alphaproteobacteria bacterium]